MQAVPTSSASFARRAPGTPGSLRGLLLAALLLLCGLLLAPMARAQGIELATLKAERDEDSLSLSFNTVFELPRPVEEALQKGVPIYFTAEVSVYRGRWYWRDARIARVSRSWRLAWQPLTRQFRVSTGGLNQTFASLHEALNAMRGAQHWHIAELSQLEDDARHYLEFVYKLDTSQLPRPMQIGLGAPEGWAMQVARTMTVDLAVRGAP